MTQYLPTLQRVLLLSTSGALRVSSEFTVVLGANLSMVEIATALLNKAHFVCDTGASACTRLFSFFPFVFRDDVAIETPLTQCRLFFCEVVPSLARSSLLQTLGTGLRPVQSNNTKVSTTTSSTLKDAEPDANPS